jgi:hypothetical protein
MASKAHLVIDQGTTYTTDLNLTDDNGDPLILDGFYANSLIKKWYTSSTSVPFNTTINTTSGVITLSLDANTTTNMTAGRYVYDVDITEISSGAVSRVVEGIITVTPSSTAKTYAAPNTNIFPNSAPLT